MNLIGPELDEITNAGYKVQSIVPNTNDGYYKIESWIYLTKP